MRVFSPIQARTAQEERIGKEALRARTLAETTRELLDTKNEVEQEFEQTMARHKAVSEQFFAEEFEKKKTLKEEVLLLEKRREAALSPLIQREKDIEYKEQKLAKDKELFEAEKEDFEDKTRVFMQNLDVLSTRQQQLDEREDGVRRMEQGALIQRDQIVEDAKKLTERLAGFALEMQQKEEELARIKSELDARKVLYDGNDEALKKREEDIRIEKIKIQDQYNILSKGFEELRNLKTKQ